MADMMVGWRVYSWAASWAAPRVFYLAFATADSSVGTMVDGSVVLRVESMDI